MTEYLKRARSAFQTFLRPHQDDPQSTVAAQATPVPASGHQDVQPVGFADPAVAAGNPKAWLSLFQEAVKEGRPISDAALGVIRESLGRQSDAAEQRATAAVGYLVSLGSQKSLSGERFGQLFHELQTPELVTLALFLQDGAATDGSAAENARQSALEALGRLRIDDEGRQLVQFLVANRFAMPRVAFRRDAGDPEVVHRFGDAIKDEERLKALTLVTLADLAAAGSGQLTPWKEELLWRLYVDTYNDLTVAYADEVIDSDEGALDALKTGRPEDVSEEELLNFVGGLPRRYLAMFDRDTIYRHVRLWRDIAPDDVHFFLKRTGEVWDLTVVTLDKPFLFSNICGVLSYFDLNIIRGHALTSNDLLVLDVFQFTDPLGVFDKEPKAREQFEALLADVVARRTDIADLLAQRHRKDEPGRQRSAPVIFFDNESSRRFTVLELIADDQPGLLYRISRAVSRHGLDVELVLISTEGDKAIDVFHLKKGADKLTDADQLALTEDLERAVGDPDIAGSSGPR